ncbi:MAG TPA: DUF433 domain-containing protein [Acidimicrobiales bacterium]|nr:DUF433 domain-containing protein [Acidimicrobiales bacterium]
MAHVVAPLDCAMSFDRITVEPGKMGGRPCIRGMRIAVRTLLGQMTAGQTVAQIRVRAQQLTPW